MFGKRPAGCLLYRLLMVIATVCGFGFARILVPTFDDVPLIVSIGFAVLVYLVNTKHLKRRFPDSKVMRAKPTVYSRLFDRNVPLQVDFDLALSFIACGIGSVAGWIWIERRLSPSSVTVVAIGVAYLLSIVRYRNAFEA